MSQIVPDAVEHYLASLHRSSDPVLDAIEREGHAQNLPIVNTEVGSLLRLLATAIGARRVLEIGTAIGYSGVWLALALPPDGLLITIEMDPERAAQARENFARAGLSDRASVMIGDAAKLISKVAGPFDLIFNDGEKRQYEPLLDRLVGLLRPRGLLITDNVLWNGEVVPGLSVPHTRDGEMRAAIASYNERLASDPRLLTTFLPVRDGVAVSLRLT